MADKIPVKATYSGSDVVGLAEYLTGETVPVANGGTGTTTSTGTGSVVLSNSPTITGLSTNSFAITDSSIVFEGATADAYETTLFITDPTADRTVTFQDLTGTVGLSTNKLSFFSSTTSAELAGVISDETGSGVLVFGTSPNFTTSVTTGSSSFDAFNTNATTVNTFGAATTLTIGGTSGTAAIRNGTISLPNATAITTGQTTVALLNTTATTVNAFGAATTISIGAATGTTTVNNNLAVTGTSALTGNTTITGTATIGGALAANGGISVDSTNFTVDGSTGAVSTASTLSVGSNATITGDLAVNGGDITTTSVGTATVFNANATTLNIGGAATTVSIGAATGTTTINNANVVITGNLTVNGTTTTINSTTTTVDDITLELGSVTTPTDVTANGGGIVLKGATDKSILWSTTGWTSSEDWNLVTGKQYEINGTAVLSATTLGSGVTASSLTSVGTIGTGTWQGSVISSTYGGTGVNNGGRTFTLSTGNLTLTAQAGGSSVTVPSTGTLATLAGTESLSNKTITSSSFSGTTGAFSGQISSSLATGTAPLSITSTTVVTNLNADLHDGYHVSESNTASYVVARDSSKNININSATFSGTTSGTVQLLPAATAGTGTIITLPATTGTVVTTGDTGTVTSTMIADGTIVNADINASAAIADTKLATISTAGKVSNSATTATNANTASAIVARDASGNFTAGTITAALSGNATSATNIASGAANQIPYQTGSGATAFIAAPTVSSTVLKWTGYAFTWGSASGLQTTDNLQITNLGLGQVAAAQGAPDNLSGNLRANTISINNAGTYRTTFTTPTLTAHRTLTVPDVSGNIVTTGDTGTVTSTMIADGTIVNADISASAAIAISKLAASTISGVSLGSNLATLTMNVSGTGLSGSTTYNGSGAATFTVTSNATSANTVSAIVARDASGNFSAGTITATISGSISGGTVSGSTLTSTVATGTAPLTVSSTTVVSNLNADLWDGNHFASYLNQAVLTTSNVQYASLGVGTAASGTSGEIRATNAITSYYSDARLKDFEGTIDNALSKVMALNGYYFTENAKAKELGYNNDARQVGVSAQEVEAVLPEVIDEAPINANFEGADYKTVHYEKLVPLLIEAIKEQQKQIEELKAKVGN